MPPQKLERPARDDEHAFYYLDNVHVTSVGVDIGSATAQLMFSEVHLQRQAQGLSSRFVVVDRNVLWRSEVRLTPYRPDGLIDADLIADFVEDCYRAAGIHRREVDGGAVILTGEALKRRNARPLAEAVAAGTGEFVCVSAGHHLEAMLTAQGSGSVDLSATTGKALLCVDIGGGTTKLSLLRDGEVAVTAAIELGARMVSFDAARAPIEANPVLATIGIDPVELGARALIDEETESACAAALTRRMLAVARRRPEEIEAALLLTGPLPSELLEFEAITFAGGVSEYIYGREARAFGDLGQAIGAAVRAAIADGSLGAEVLDPGEGIRATVAGASQCAVQVSGSTVAVSADADLPLRNVPVVHPATDLQGALDAGMIAAAIRRAVTAHGVEGAVALAFSFSGPPSYARLRALADGIGAGLGDDTSVPAVVMLDSDIGASLGQILGEEVGMKRPVICLDNLELKPFDFVDIGRPMLPSGVFPIVIKSLLFGSTT